VKLSEAINRDLESARVHIVYANRGTIKIWNEMKPHDDPPIFCGWYWMAGLSEGGPFRCESACMRDAWYRVCKRMAPPSLYHAGGLTGVTHGRMAGENVTHLTLPKEKLKLRLVT
jgi:hypothetical protein